MKKVAIYCRLSDEDRVKKTESQESESIQNQKSMLIAYALEQNWDIYNIYSDEDYSGADRNRPEFNKMLKDCEDRKIDIVLCKTQSRFSRDMEVIERYLHDKFLEWKIRFVSILDHADTDQKSNKKARQINGLINEWYLEDLSENIRSTIKHKKQKGEFTGSFAPYGYMIDPNNKNHLVIDPVASEVVKTIFSLYAGGYGYKKIADYLNKRNIPNPTLHKKQLGIKFHNANGRGSGVWTTDTLQIILKNGMYTGSLVHAKTQRVSYKNNKKINMPESEWIVIPNCHERIIDQETWNIVQKKFSNRTRSRVQTGIGEVHIFSQKLYCKTCQKIFKKNSGKNNYDKIFVYFKCSSKIRGGAECSNKHSIRIEVLEDVILKEINALLDKYYNPLIIDEQLSSRQKILDDFANKLNIYVEEQEKIEKLIKKKQLAFKKLYDDKLDGIISDEDFTMLTESYRQDVSKLEKRLIVIKDEIEILNNKQNKDSTRNEILEKYQKIEKLDRIIIDDFIDKIEIGELNSQTKEREIAISWNI